MTAVLYALLAAVVVLIIAAIRFFRRATQDISLVRTGLGGTKVAIGGGLIHVPLLHNLTRVSMNTMRLELARTHDKALITGDRMRADVVAEFYVRVRPERDAVALAAQTLGSRTLDPSELKALVEGKFVDALRSVAAEKTMEELHANRRAFARAVTEQLAESLGKNGLELESVSITALDQTSIEYFNPSNAFDAEGLTRLTEQIEQRKKKRNDIEQDTSIAVQRKTLETEKTRLQLEQESEYARLQQQHDIAERRASQQSEIAEHEARSRLQSEQSRQHADYEVERQRIDQDRLLAEQREQVQSAVEIIRMRGIQEQAHQELEQNRILAELERGRSELELDRERVITAREMESAERDKAIELIKAAREAEREGEYRRILARIRRELVEMESEERTLSAQAEAEAARLAAEGDLARRRSEAEGTKLLNAARNELSEGQTAAELRRRLIEALPEIISASAEPIKSVDSIRVAKIDGLTHPASTRQGNGSAGSGSETSRGGLGQELLSAMLEYRAQAPIIDSLLREVGLDATGTTLQPDDHGASGDRKNEGAPTGKGQKPKDS